MQRSDPSSGQSAQLLLHPCHPFCECSGTDSELFRYFVNRRRSWRLRELQKAKRNCPREVAAGYLLAFIESLPKAKQREILNLLRRPKSAYEKMENFTDSEDLTWRVSNEGIVLWPRVPEGIAVLAILLPNFHGQLSRIKRYLHCKDWFDARFKTEEFCANPKTKCQSSHCHTPPWLKQYQQLNRIRKRRDQESGSRADLSLRLCT